jgi:hypothetical protein
MNNEKRINNLSELLSTVKADTSSWTHTGFAKPWFRGHTNTKYTLLPSILRKGNEANEFEITTKFRLLAPGYIEVPETGRLDQWLFLMQHHRLPTRLLDWTENPLYAALFATTKAFDTEKEIENDAAIYCIDPIALNHLSGFDYFPNTWTQTSVLQTIKFAFGTQNDPVNGQKIMYLENPVAIYPSTIHSRIKRLGANPWAGIIPKTKTSKIHNSERNNSKLSQGFVRHRHNLRNSFSRFGRPFTGFKISVLNKRLLKSKLPFNIAFGVDPFSLPSAAARAQLKRSLCRIII